MDRNDPAERSVLQRAGLPVAGALGVAGAVLAYRQLVVPDPALSWAFLLETWFFEADRRDVLSPLLIAGWLLRRRRGRLRAIRVTDARATLPGAVALGLAAALLLGWSTRTGAPDWAVFSLILAGLALAFAWGGAAAARIAAPPLALLLFAVPLPAPLYNTLVWELQLGTTLYVATLLEALGLEVWSSGDLILVGDHVFEVIESCAALRIIWLLTLISFAMAEGLRLRRRPALLFVAVAPGVGFLVNGLRALWIAVTPSADTAGHHFGQGILTLGAACALQLALGWGMRRLRLGAPLRDPAPTTRRGEGGLGAARRGWAPALALSAALAAVSVAAPTPDRKLASTPGLAPLRATRSPEWEWEDWPLQLTFLGATRFGESVRRIYRPSDGQDAIGVELFAGVGASDGRRGFPFGPKGPLPGPGWVFELELPGESRIEGAPLRIWVVRLGDARMLVHYYRSGDRGLLADSLRSLAALDAIAAAGTRRAVVRLATPLADAGELELERAEIRLDALVESLRDPFTRILIGDPAHVGVGATPAGSDQSPMSPRRGR